MRKAKGGDAGKAHAGRNDSGATPTIKVDFHVHTKYSIDSLIEPHELSIKSARLGIVPAVADHNSTECHAVMRALKAPFIPAEEIFTDRGDLIGLYISETIPKKTPFLEAIDKIHEQGGLAYLPHMYDYGRSKAHSDDKTAAKVDVVEVFNARCLKQAYNERAAAFARKHGLPGAAGSDSHFLMEFGHTYTTLPEFDIGDPISLIRALRKRYSEAGNWKLVTKPAFPLVRGSTTFVSIGRKLMRRLSI